MAAKKPKPTAADYGYVKAFLDAHPDVAAKVKSAVAHGYTPQRLQAEIKTTKWWTTRTDSQRKYDVLSTENPKEAARQISVAQESAQTEASNLGVSLAPKDLAALAKQFVVNGSSPEEIRAVLAKHFSLPGSGNALTGTAAGAEGDLNTMADAYGLRLSDATKQNYIRQIISGDMDANGFEDVMREQAKTLYPPIADILDRGVSVRQYLSPYLEIAGKELGVPPDSMNTSDPKWTKVIHGEAGVPMNSDEWTKTIRTDATYGWDHTMAARGSAAQMASEFGKLFGQIA